LSAPPGSPYTALRGNRELAAEFVEYILQRAEKAGREVYEKAKEIVEEGKAKSSMKLKGFEERVEVNGKTYVVKVIDGGAVEEDRDGRKLLRIKITAEVVCTRAHLEDFMRFVELADDIERWLEETGR
jgi:hypothetical protein